MSRSSDHAGSELPPATLSLWGDPPVVTSTLTRFVRILQNNCCSAHLVSKQIIQSIGCSQDLNNCRRHLVICMYVCILPFLPRQRSANATWLPPTGSLTRWVKILSTDCQWCRGSKNEMCQERNKKDGIKLLSSFFKRLMLCCCPVQVVEDKPRWLKNISLLLVVHFVNNK